MMNNITPIILALIALIGAILTYLLRRYVLPWLEEQGLVSAADIAVNFAEAMIGRGHGEEKLEQALDYLKGMGYDVDSEAVIAAVKAAWYSLNLSQMASGVKAIDGKEG